MSIKFTQRSDEMELLDLPGIPRDLLFKNLHELDLVNRTLGGHAVSLAGIKKLIHKKNKTYSIVDIGCGGGDVLIRIADWARKNKYQVQLTGVDSNADAIAYLNETCKTYPEIEGVVCTYQDFLEMNMKVDIVHCSLFCHHLKDAEVKQLFIYIREHVREGFVINDLHRHWFAYYSIKFLTRLLNGSLLVKNDAPLSVLRGFKKNELKKLLKEAGINDATVKWNWAFRYLIVNHCMESIRS